MSVPFLDIKASYLELKDELDAAYRRVMESGWYILGAEVEAFEQEFTAYCGARHCIGVGNGLEALQLVLHAYGIGEGHEVIVPANTYIATWLAVSYVGARPVPVEPDSRTYNLDPDRVEVAITDRTRAIMPVHLYGQPADLSALRAIASRHGLRLVADAAQAHGARCGGQIIGAGDDAAAFSFYPGKNLGGYGDAGAVVTDDETLADRLRLLRNYGSRVKYQNEVKGHNSRLDPLQAAFLRVRLKYLDEWNERRRALAHTYQQQLQDLPGLVLPFVPSWAQPNWHQFVVRHAQRDALQSHLSSAGIGTLIHYPVPPHLSDAYRLDGWRMGDFPITEVLSREVLSLPMGPHLNDSAQGVVVAAVKSFFSAPG